MILRGFFAICFALLGIYSLNLGHSMSGGVLIGVSILILASGGDKNERNTKEKTR